MSERGEFERELIDLLNRHSEDNAANTPDFVLASYLKACLANFAIAVRVRDAWLARPSSPNATHMARLGSVIDALHETPARLTPDSENANPAHPTDDNRRDDR